MINWKTFFLNEKKNLELLNSRGHNYTDIILKIKTFNNLGKEIRFLTENLQAQRNEQSQKFFKSQKSFFIKTHKEIIIVLKTVLEIINVDLEKWSSSIPNIPNSKTPLGLNSVDNVVLNKFTSNISVKNKLSHWEIVQKLGWINSKQSVLMSQQRSIIYQGEGAQLLRALINFMLDQHLSNDYHEIIPPYLVKGSSLWGTGQFPKMQNDCYQIKNQDLFLIPTSEVPLVNFYRDQIIPYEELPIKLCAYSRCFRRESGAAGTKTRGLIRLHEFHKVELVQITLPENSEQTLKNMIENSSNLLKMLGLSYQVVMLCRGELSFSSNQTYDLEVWMPYQKKYLEIASLSNTTDFQSNYLKIRTSKGKKNSKQLLHTLNGSALALDRLLAALLEYYYDEEKNVFHWPKVLKKYLGKFK